MRLTVILVLAACLKVSAGGYAQQITLRAKDMPCESVFREITRQSGYQFFFNKRLIRNARNVSVELNAVPVEKAIEICFANQPFGYAIINKTVVIRKKEERLVVIPEIAPAEIPPVTVRGKITDEQGNVLPGASVRIKSSGKTILAGEDGVFSIEANTGDRLEISFVGFETQEIPVGNTASVRIILKATNAGLNEVVVVGYGKQKKVNLTGAISSVSGAELTRSPIGQTSMVLQGLVPGLTVTQRSGQPGADGGGIRVRGVGTLGDSNPLIILDGVESDINNVDPNDIESITVLKDASSAAIYGARAANGVILITTKRAGKKGVSLSYNSYVGIQSPTTLPDIVNAIDHMEMTNEAYINVGNTPLYSPQIIDEYKTMGPGDRDKYPDTDWQKITLNKNATMQSHHVGIMAGGDRVKLMGSLSYLDQDGVVPNTNFKRYNLRLNTDIQLTDKLNGVLDLSLRRTDSKEPSVGPGYMFQFLRSNNATNPAIFSNGLYGEGYNGENPLARAHDGGLHTDKNLLGLINLGLKYKFTSFLWAEANYAPRFSDAHSKSFFKRIQMYKPDFSLGMAVPGVSSLNEQFSRSWYNNMRATVNFDKEVILNHNFKMLAGVQQEDQSDNFVSAFRQVYNFPDYQVINSGNQLNQSTGGSATHWALRSFFGRFNYNYKEKYLFEANGRYDGSSRFADGNKYAFFPSVSAGWRISEEVFMKDLFPFIRDLKIRASWGRLGNQNIGLYPYVSSVSVGTNYPFGLIPYTGAAITDMANEDIKWETTTTSDIGLDINLWSKLTITADYYYRKTTDILLQLPISGMLGLTAPYQNAGVVENRGWELSASYRDQVGDFRYGLALMLSDVKNKILDMKGSKTTGLNVNFEGYPIGSLYGYEADGYFKDAADVANNPIQFGNVAAGDIKYNNLDDDKTTISGSDQTIIGSIIPRYTYSANIDLGYKGFDFSLFLQGVGKADGYMSGRGVMPFWNGGTVLEIHKDRWMPGNTNAAFPRLAYGEINNIQHSSFWIRNAAYMRIKNIQLGYTFNNSTLRIIRGLRVYVSAQNLFTFDNFWSGYDVEAPVTSDYQSAGWYPQMKVISGGLNVNF